MVKSTVIVSFVLIFFSCKKAEDRTCYKSYGSLIEKEIPLDSVSKFMLYKNITYYIYQDTMRKLVVRTGENLMNHIAVENDETVLTIKNENRCNFWRDFDKKTIVEIHYPFYKDIYSEANDSLIFKTTIVGDYLEVEQNLGGAAVFLDVDVKHIIMIASGGVGTYVLSGKTNYADLRVQTNGAGDASQLKSNFLYVYSNTTGDISVDADTTEFTVDIRGTGNILYSGIPDSLSYAKSGDGELIKQ